MRRPMAVGGAIRQRIARVASAISIGRYSVNRPVAQIQPQGGESPMPARRVVGTSFLEHFVVTIDGTNNRIQLANGPEAPMTPPAVRYLGMSLKQIDDLVNTAGGDLSPADLKAVEARLAELGK